MVTTVAEAEIVGKNISGFFKPLFLCFVFELIVFLVL